MGEQLKNLKKSVPMENKTWGLLPIQGPQDDSEATFWNFE